MLVYMAPLRQAAMSRPAPQLNNISIVQDPARRPGQNDTSGLEVFS
jgi:hypothetical protein